MRTTSKWPPSYGVSSGPSNEPIRWYGELSTSSILTLEALSFLQSVTPLTNNGFKRGGRTCLRSPYSRDEGGHP